MRNYGNLRKYLPITFATMAVGFLALAGVPWLFSGFWSKEAILGPAVNATGHGAFMLGPVSAGQIAGWVGFFVAGLTACYMTRMMALTFFNKEERWKLIPAAAHDGHGLEAHAGHDSHSHHDDPHGFYLSDDEAAAQHEEHEHSHALDETHKPHEVPWVMWVPLAVLAVFSFGWIGWILNDQERFFKWLYPLSEAAEHQGPVSYQVLIGLSLVTSLGGILVGAWIWGRKLPAWEGFDLAKWNPVQKWAGRQWGYDALVSDGSVKAGAALGWLSQVLDTYVVDGIVRGVGVVAKGAGSLLTATQTGKVRGYALVMQIGAAAFIGYVLYVLSVGGPK